MKLKRYNNFLNELYSNNLKIDWIYSVYDGLYNKWYYKCKYRESHFKKAFKHVFKVWDAPGEYTTLLYDDHELLTDIKNNNSDNTIDNKNELELDHYYSWLDSGQDVWHEDALYKGYYEVDLAETETQKFEKQDGTFIYIKNSEINKKVKDELINQGNIINKYKL